VTDEPLTPPERRVNELLRALGEDGPPARGDLAAQVVRTARWQHAVRGSLAATSELAAVAGVAVRLLLGSPGRRP
jgi:hypothetical protein